MPLKERYIYSFGSTAEERNEVDETTRQCYEQKVGAWLAVEAIVQQLNKEKTAQAVAKLSSESGSEHKNKMIDVDMDGDIDNDVFEENGFSDLSDPEDDGDTNANDENSEPAKPSRVTKSSTDSGNVPDADIKCEDVAADEKQDESEPTDVSLLIDESFKESTAVESNKSSPSTSSYETVANDFGDMEQFSEHPGESSNQSNSSQHHAFIITNASIDIANINDDDVAHESVNMENELPPLHEVSSTLETETLQEPKSACVSPASSSGGVYSVRKSRFMFVPSSLTHPYYCKKNEFSVISVLRLATISN